MHQALWSMVLASLLLDRSLTSHLGQAGLTATKSRLKYEAAESDLKSAAVKKKEEATAPRQKKKAQPASSKDKFSLSVQDMLAKGWDGRQLELKNEAGSTPDYCPRYNCETDPKMDWKSIQDANETEGNVNGFFRSVCSATYFIGAVEKTWRGAAADCCKRNMRLITITSAEEATCVTDFFNGNLPPNRWWIGSSDKAQEGQFRWCFPNSADLLESTFPLPFAKGEPGENQDAEDCLEIINRNDVLALNDRACEASAQFICEEAHEGEAMSVMSWLLKTGSVSTIGMRKAHGSQNTFFTACYRFYALIKPKKLTQSKGASECCKYGLKVASLDSPLELQCVKQFLATEPAGTYWTSGTGLDGEFAWCPSGKGIDGQLWIPSEKPKSKKCVSLVIGEASGLENSPCDNPHHVLCESNYFFF